jgi:Tachylectin/FG-GAP-like repeat
VLSRPRIAVFVVAASSVLVTSLSAVAPAQAQTLASPVVKSVFHAVAATSPSSNIDAVPAYPAICQSSPSDVSCQNAGIAALNRARVIMGQPAYVLPANFEALSAPMQLLVLSNSDRGVYGLPQISGLNATLNAAAQSGIAADNDPAGPSSVDGVGFTSWTSNWAAGWSSALYVYYNWMYDDGMGSSNLDCTSTNGAGCWGHRLDTLHDFGSSFVAMGVGTGTSPANHSPAFTELYEGFKSPVSLSTAAPIMRGARPGSIRQVLGSGRGDLLGRRSDGSLWLYANAGGALPYSSGAPVGSGWQGFTNISAADVNCDGFSDIVATSSDGTLWYYPNAVATAGGVPYNSGIAIGSGFQVFNRVLLADISGDGCADLVATKSDGTLWYYPNNMSSNPGHVPFSSGIQVGTGWNAFSQISVGDVTGDGSADLIATTSSGALYLYPNNTNSNPGHFPFSFGSVIGSGWTGMSSVLLSDVSGDGYADLVATGSDGSLHYYPNNMKSNLGHLPFTFGSEIGSGWQIFNKIG